MPFHTLSADQAGDGAGGLCVASTSTKKSKSETAAYRARAFLSTERSFALPVAAPSVKGVTPFLKWAGGKGQLLPQLDHFIPRELHTYYEPFLGGGALFFHLEPERAVLSDSNPELIGAFLAVRDDPTGLMRALDVHSRGRLSEEYFYRIRDGIDPAKLSPVKRAARTIFLNKTCFNGLYRVNARGRFNVPWGSYKNPTLYNRENILGASRVLRGKRILLTDYRTGLRGANLGDFVYLDPPYHPLSDTSKFTSYTKEDFSDSNQRELAETCRHLDSKGALFALSNSPTPLTLSLYHGFRIERLRAKRAISSKGTGRGPIDELLVMNYS